MRHAMFLMAVTAAIPLIQVGADPLKTPACTQALGRLQQLEAAAVAAHRSRPDGDQRSATQAVKAQQRRTAVACQLDTDPPAPPQAPRVREPVRVTPLVLAPSALPRQPSAATPPAPASEQGPRTVTLGACDKQGCWTSDGRRLSRAGALLLGPNGYCTQQGLVLRCP